ncbi:MAG: efflux transporter outer membrane subunit [Pseudomonas sp.]|nr:efflux transporter outer membrane subunit [Pseudomonas sp.]
MRINLLVALLAVGFSGCTVGPDYQRPHSETPSQWRGDYAQMAELTNTKWWEQFADPVLNKLVESALRENLDVAVAAARVDQFIGALTATRAQLSPQIGYAGAADRSRASRVGQPPLPPGADPYFSLYQASLGASWQLDLFGRVRRLSEAAQAQVYASEQAQRGVALSLVASVTTSYISLRALDRQLEIAQATAKNFGTTARLFELRFKVGIVGKTEVMQVTSQHQQALAAIPAFEQAIAAQENLLSILLGRNPGPIPRGKSIEQLVAPLIPADLPVALLQRRPDILQAEQNLVAANANVGATRALYYPSVSITGALGSVSSEFSKLLTGPASAGFIAAGVSGPLFTAGGIEGQVQSAEAQKRQATLLYQQTILNAFRETNDALTGAQKKTAEVALQQQRVTALRELAQLSRLRFDKGVAGYLDVLVAENELFAAELAAVGLQANNYSQFINLYQAMGGGWVDIATSMTVQPQGGLSRAAAQ